MMDPLTYGTSVLGILSLLLLFMGQGVDTIIGVAFDIICRSILYVFKGCHGSITIFVDIIIGAEFLVKHGEVSYVIDFMIDWERVIILMRSIAGC